MRWDLEEMVETAVANYLKAQVNGELQVYAAWDFETPKYPCAIIHCGSTGPSSDDAEWSDARKADIQVAVMTEAAPETDDYGNTIIPTRMRNAAARSKVLDALCISGLEAALQSQMEDGTDSIALSMAQVVGTERAVEDDSKTLTTIIKIEAILEPVTGSTFTHG